MIRAAQQRQVTQEQNDGIVSHTADHEALSVTIPKTRNWGSLLAAGALAAGLAGGVWMAAQTQIRDDTDAGAHQRTTAPAPDDTPATSTTMPTTMPTTMATTMPTTVANAGASSKSTAATTVAEAAKRPPSASASAQTFTPSPPRSPTSPWPHSSSAANGAPPTPAPESRGSEYHPDDP